MFAAKGTHCIDPPVPAEEKKMELHPSLDPLALTEFGDDVEYTCRNGRKYIDDIFKANETKNCTEGNIWVNDLGQCVESKSDMRLNCA